MGDPLFNEQIIEMRFDRWIKKSFKNELKNYRKETARLAANEALFSEFDEEQVEAFEDKQAREPFDYLGYEFKVLQYSVEVQDTLLHDALLQIGERERSIILMAYWLDMSDLEISDETDIPRRTVNDIKRRTFGKLRKILEGKGYDANSFFQKDCI